MCSQTMEEVERIAAALIKKSQMACSVELPSIRKSFSAKLVSYSNAAVTAERLARAAADCFPSRDVELT